jgi:hypothetical protein
VLHRPTRLRMRPRTRQPSRAAPLRAAA